MDPRVDALTLKSGNDSTAAKLQNLYGGIVEAVENGLVSAKLKNKSYENIRGASVEVYRMQTAVSRTYGTARTATKGDKVMLDPIVIKKTTHLEIVEEWKNGEMEMAGVPDAVARRRDSHVLTMLTDIDTAFFAKAVEVGTEIDVAAITGTVQKINKVIQTVEKTKNKYIKNGVNRAFLRVVVTPEVYDAISDYITTLPSPVAGGMSQQYFKGVPILVNLNQTVDVIVMANESIAQPIDLTPYKAVEPDLGNEIAVKSFYDFGTEAVMDDLIAYATVLDTEVSA